MQIPQKSFRAPAEIPLKCQVSAINRLFQRLADRFFPCKHRHTSMPFNDRQRCLDCGAWRWRISDFDYETGLAGLRTGEWHRDRPMPMQNAQRLVDSRLIKDAVASGPRNGLEAILLPGSENPIFHPQQPLEIRKIEHATEAIYQRHASAVRG